MSEQAAAGGGTRKRMTGAQALDALHEVAALEHAHCVHHLRLHCVLDGHAPERLVALPERVREAAGAALLIAQSDMFHLRDVNRVLVLAGREPVLERTRRIRPKSGPPIDLAPMTPAQFSRFPERETALARALDSAYAGLRKTMGSSTPPALPNDVLAELRSMLDLATGPGMDHAGRLVGLTRPLAGMAPSEYLRVTGEEAADELDRRLLALSDSFYGSLLAVLRDHFADVEGVGPPLRQLAVSRMEDLDEVNGILGLRGLLPAFTAP